ncbi:MAG: hypothetical protein NT051_04385 [Candidatus Micrarchaeota archaeon]|nr:hypothetical protein [Candidatus Micrarchaeota archaeon]
MSIRKNARVLRITGCIALGTLVICSIAKFSPKTERPMGTTNKLEYEEQKVRDFPIQLGKPCSDDTANKTMKIVYINKDGTREYKTTVKTGQTVNRVNEDLNAVLKNLRSVPCSIKPYPNWESFLVSNIKILEIDQSNEIPIQWTYDGRPGWRIERGVARLGSSTVWIRSLDIDFSLERLGVLVHEAGHQYAYHKRGLMRELSSERQAERFALEYFDDVQKKVWDDAIKGDRAFQLFGNIDPMTWRIMDSCTQLGFLNWPEALKQKVGTAERWLALCDKTDLEEMTRWEEFDKESGKHRAQLAFALVFGHIDKKRRDIQCGKDEVIQAKNKELSNSLLYKESSTYADALRVILDVFALGSIIVTILSFGMAIYLSREERKQKKQVTLNP